MILIGSYNCVRDAVQLADRGVREGASTEMLVFRRDLYVFLQPLAAFGVAVTEFAEVRVPRLRNPMALLATWRACRMAIVHIRSREQRIRACVYNTAFNLVEIAAVGFLLKKAEVRYSAYDGRYRTRILRERVSGWRHWVQGLVYSACCGSPVELVRPWSPVPALREIYLREHCAELVELPAADLSDGSPLWKALAQRSGALVVWLWDDYVAHYGPGKVDSETFQSCWSSAVALVSQYVPVQQQAVKAHPDSKGFLPAWFAGIEELPRKTPIEFCEFPRIKAVVGVASCAMLSFPGARIVSLPDLLGGDETVVSEGTQVLAALQKEVAISRISGLTGLAAECERLRCD